MDILYLTDVSQVQYILDKKPELFKSMLPLTGDIIVASELEKLKINFIDEWDFLSADEIEKNWNIANTLSSYWAKEIKISEVKYNEIQLFDAARQEIVYPLEACLNARIVYEKIFKKYDVKRILGFFLKPIGIIRTGPLPTHRAVRSVSQAVLFWIAHVNNIPVIKLDSNYPLSHGLLLPKKKFGFTQKNVFHSILPVKENEKTVLIVLDGMDEREYSALETIFNNLKGWRLVPLTNYDLKHYVLETDKNNIIKNSLILSWNSFLVASTNYNGLYPEFFSNPYLKFQFQTIWDEIKAAIDLGEVFSVFLDVLKPEMVIFGHEAFTIENVYVKLAQKKGVSTLSLLHGGLGCKFGFRGITGNAEYILCWTDSDVNYLNEYGISKSRLFKVGCIRYEDKFKNYKNGIITRKNTYYKKINKYDDVFRNKPTILLLTSAINSGFSGPVASPRKHRETFNYIINLISARKDLQFLIKAHPSYDYYEMYRNLRKEKLSNLLFLEQITLDEAIERSDLCLMVNYFTTAALETMLNKVPVIYFENAIYPLENWVVNDPNRYIFHINSLSELEKTIDVLLTNSPEFQNVIINQDKFINQVFNNSEIFASEKFLTLFYNIINSTQNEEKEKRFDQLIINNLFSKGINKEIIEHYFEDLSQNQSLEHKLFVFSYMAGINKKGIRYISNIARYNQHWEIKDKRYWTLLNAYIRGSNRNFLCDSFLSVFLLFLKIFTNPKKFLKMSNVEKKDVIKYLYINIFKRSVLH